MAEKNYGGLILVDGSVTWIIDDLMDQTPVGTVRASLYLPKGYVIADGSTVKREDYPRLVQWIEENKLWTEDVDKNLGLFGVGDKEQTFTLPNYIGRVAEYARDAGGTLSAGLPNIKGSAKSSNSSSVYGVVTNGDSTILFDGALLSTRTIAHSMVGANMGYAYDIAFDASKSNAIYGSSDTVQPPAIKVLPILRY